MELLVFIKTHFFHVLPILVVGGIATAIIIERCFALFYAYPIRSEASYFDRIRELVMADEVAEAVALCDRYSSKPVAQVIKKGLLRAHQPETLVENGLEIAVEEAVQRVQQRTGYLATIANVVTLLGLLLTVAGLVEAFQAVGAGSGGAKEEMLAAGISQAMNATMLGLGVAIPCMLAYSFLQNKTNKTVSRIESAAVRLLDILKQRYFSIEAQVMGDEPTPEPEGSEPNKEEVA